MEKVKVFNCRKYCIGLLLQNGSERIVQPGSFVTLSHEDIEYLSSVAPKLFADEKQLCLEDRTLAVQLGFVMDEQAEMLDAESIRKHLAQRASQVKAWLEGINEPYLLDAICDVAVEMDLPASKLLLLKERMPEREFIREE